MATYRPLNAPMQTGGQDPYANLRFAGHVDWRHVNPQLLNALQNVAHARGLTVDVISGYRDNAYSAAHGGFAGDPHTEGIAIDAYVGGKPIGDVVPTSVWGQFGVRSGNTFVYHGKPDPEHLDLLGGAARTLPAVTGKDALILQAYRDAVNAGIDPQLFLRQINQESGFRPDARSGAGAVGIAQIVPKYHPGVDPTNATAALRWAADYMAGLVHKYGGSYQKALSVYNSGSPTAYLDPHFSGGQTYNYVKDIVGGAPVPVPAGGLSNPVAPPTTVPAQQAAQNQKALSVLNALLQSSSAPAPTPINLGFAPITAPAQAAPQVAPRFTSPFLTNSYA